MSYAGDVKLQIAQSRIDSQEAVLGEKLAYTILHGNVAMSENKAYIERIATIYTYADSKAFIRFFTRRLSAGTNMYGVEFSASFDAEAVFSPEFAIGFIRACFIKNGFVSAPDKASHFEISFDDEDAKDVCLRSFEEIDCRMGETMRSGKYLLYIKDSGKISDLLARLGAVRAMLQYENGRIMKEANNMANRGFNCDMANLNKTISCAQKQIEMIKSFSKLPQFALLPKDLKDMARVRVENPDASLSDLGQLFNPPLTKSGVTHRLSKIKQLYQLYQKK